MEDEIRGDRWSLRRRISGMFYQPGERTLYIGATSNYKDRRSKHWSKYRKRGFIEKALFAAEPYRMVVLWMTKDYSEAVDVERDLIAFYRPTGRLENDPAKKGGEGIRQGKDAYYIYALFGHTRFFT